MGATKSMTRWEKELVKLVKIVGEGKDIAELSAKSFELSEFDNWEAHEIYDVARASSNLTFNFDDQTVFLADKLK